MPRLGVPSTTDSAPRADATAVANRPPAAVDKSPAQRSTWRLSRGSFNLSLKAGKRDERKAFARLRTPKLACVRRAAPACGQAIAPIAPGPAEPAATAPLRSLVGQHGRKHHLGLYFSAAASAATLGR